MVRHPAEEINLGDGEICQRERANTKGERRPEWGMRGLSEVEGHVIKEVNLTIN